MIPKRNKSFSNYEDMQEEVLGRFQLEKIKFLRKKKVKKQLAVSLVLLFSSVMLLLIALENKQFRTFAKHIPVLDKVIETIIDEEYIEEGIELYAYLPVLRKSVV